MNKKLLFLIILIGLIIRVILLSSHDIIEIDGSDYIRLAENLVSGKGYTDLSGGTHVLFPPLYSIISGMFGLILGNFELAGRIISLIFGIGLIFLVYLIGKKFYDEKVGLIAAGLTALYPALTYVSGITYTETLYLFLIFLGLYLGWISLEKRKNWMFFATGLVFGLAYLTRSEGLILSGVIILFILILRRNWKFKIKKIAFLLAGLLIISCPYLIFLYNSLDGFSLGIQSTGKFLEQAYTMIHTDNITEYELNYVSLDTSAEGFKGEDSLFSYILRNPKNFFKRYFSNFYIEQTETITKLYPLPFIFIAICGILLGGWDFLRKKRELYLSLFFIIPLLIAPVGYVSPKIFLSSLIILLLWTSNGVKELDKIIRKNIGLGNLILILILVIFLFGNFLISSVNVSVTNFTWDSRDANMYKETGLWIKENSENSVVMARDGRIAFYAGARYVKLAYGDVNYIIKEACKQDVDFIVLDRRLMERLRPELVYLLDERSTPNNLKFVHKFDDSVVIYSPMC